MKKFILISFFIIVLKNFAFIHKIEKVKSEIMNKKIPITIILPKEYSEKEKYSVIYGLHGWGGSFRSFARAKNIKELADKYNVILVFPDGNWNSWYINSEKKKNSNYSTFISQEVVNYVDSKYSTIKERNHRAIIGFSMGGFGAFYNGINYPNVFGNIGDISGGVFVEKWKRKWGIHKVINNEDYSKYNIIDNIGRLKENNFKTNIIIDVGNKDFFLEDNRELHKKLNELEIEHTYIERKGRHRKSYWVKSWEIMLEFFSQKFNESNEKIGGIK